MSLSIVDTFRGAYVRSPYLVRRTLAPFLSLLPTDMKFGSAYRDWRRRISRADTDATYASAQQLRSLRGLLAKAHTGSPFYRELIDRAFGSDFDATRFELEHLRQLPVLGKNELREAGDRALAVPRWQVDVAETSGSNAEAPFSFYLDKDRSAREMAFVYSVWARTGYLEQHARATLRGIGVGPNQSLIHQWDPALRELQLSAFPLTREDTAVYLDEIDRRGIRYLYGYPSSIELFCRQMLALGRTPREPLRGILPISEPLHEHQRRIITSVLGDVSIAVFYGLSEKVVFGAEVEGQPGVYQSNPLYGVAELVDGCGLPVTKPGAEGRLVGTGFISTGMPFIRYDTGDIAELVEAPSPRNGQRLKVRALSPRRKPGYLIGAEGERLVTIDLTPEDESYFDGIEEFQFYQDTPGEVSLRYVESRHGETADVARLIGYLSQRTGGRLHFKSERVERLASGRGGKRAYIDQRLNSAFY